MGEDAHSRFKENSDFEQVLLQEAAGARNGRVVGGTPSPDHVKEGTVPFFPGRGNSSPVGLKMVRTVRRQVWFVVMVIVLFFAGIILFLNGGKWHWADVRPFQDFYSRTNR